MLIIIVSTIIGYTINKGYQSKQAKQKLLTKGFVLAEKHCSTCHLLPQPSMLPRELWNTSVLPNMGSRMGLKAHFDYFYPPVDFSDIPTKPVMSQDEWNTLVYYYLSKAPESLEPIKSKNPAYDSTFFASEIFMDFKGGIITALKAIQGKIYIAEAIDSTIYQVNTNNSDIDTLKYKWPVTDIKSNDQNLFFTSPGYLHPADFQMGKVLVKGLNSNNEAATIIIDSLRRSLRTEISDFDQNGYQDFLICEFGHNYGQLSLYFQLSANNFKKQILSGTPGAICAHILDFNQDGFKDIMALFAQGDERIVLYTNLGNQKFKSETIYQFPSIYGSLYFELVDFNQDGLVDILYTNGDNGDYTPIPKPYHGIRLLINQGDFKLKETWFYPIHGAAMAKSFDFDQDGKIDIIATSNFSKSGKPVKEGLIFFRQESNFNFTPYVFTNGTINQWNLIELIDIEQDGDQDILIGAMNLDAIRMQQSIGNQSLDSLRYSILLLKNQTR